MRTIMILLGSAMLLSACGSKGPLYLPPPAQQAPAAAADNSTAPGATR